VVEMRIDLETSPRVWANHRNLYWIAACLLSAFVGAAIMNGQANQRVIEAKNASCHWTIQHELQKQKTMLEGQ